MRSMAIHIVGTRAQPNAQQSWYLLQQSIQGSTGSAKGTAG
jgi:hypothetical protein